MYDNFKHNFPQGCALTELEPQMLDYSEQIIRRDTQNCIVYFMKHAADFSNNNLVRNANALTQSIDAKIDKEYFSWINNSLSQKESKFKLTY